MDLPTARRGVSMPDCRLRTVSKRVFHGTADLPDLDANEVERLLDTAVNSTAWWPGEILTMQVPSPASAKEPVLAWLAKKGFPAPVLQEGDGLFLTEGSWFHHDADDYPASLFCVQWLEETDPWDLLFPESGLRIPLTRGTIVLFDPSNVHGVVYRGKDVFDQEGFLGGNGVQLFSSMCLELTDAYVDLFDIRWHSRPTGSVDLTWLRHPFSVCQETGALRRHQPARI